MKQKITNQSSPLDMMELDYNHDWELLYYCEDFSLNHRKIFLLSSAPIDQC